MQIRVRHVDESDPVDFTEVHYDEVQGLISFIEGCGGFYTNSQMEPYHSHQLVLDGEAYLEIIVGSEPAKK
jgi:hypothetical protein